MLLQGVSVTNWSVDTTSNTAVTLNSRLLPLELAEGNCEFLLEIFLVFLLFNREML